MYKLYKNDENYWLDDETGYDVNTFLNNFDNIDNIEILNLEELGLNELHKLPINLK